MFDVSHNIRGLRSGEDLFMDELTRKFTVTLDSMGNLSRREVGALHSPFLWNSQHAFLSKAWLEATLVSRPMLAAHDVGTRFASADLPRYFFRHWNRTRTVGRGKKLLGRRRYMPRKHCQG